MRAGGGCRVREWDGRRGRARRDDVLLGRILARRRLPQRVETVLRLALGAECQRPDHVGLYVDLPRPVRLLGRIAQRQQSLLLLAGRRGVTAASGLSWVKARTVDESAVGHLTPTYGWEALAKSGTFAVRNIAGYNEKLAETARATLR